MVIRILDNITGWIKKIILIYYLDTTLRFHSSRLVEKRLRGTVRLRYQFSVKLRLPDSVAERLGMH